MSSVPIIYITADSIFQIYLAEIIYGVGSGLANPNWLGLWSKNLECGQESFQWSIYSTSTGLGTAATGTIGAASASFLGLATTFLLAGILCLLGCLTLIVLESKSRNMIENKKSSKEYRGGLGPVSMPSI